MATIQYEVDIDLTDLEDDFKRNYCDRDNCLKDTVYLKEQLTDYVKEMENNLYFYADKHKQFKSYEEIYRDLDRIIKEN